MNIITNARTIFNTTQWLYEQNKNSVKLSTLLIIIIEWSVLSEYGHLSPNVTQTA